MTVLDKQQLENLIAEIDKQEFIQFFKEHGNQAVFDKYGITTYNLKYLKNRFNIVLTEEEMKVRDAIAVRESFQRRLGVDNPGQLPDVKEKIKNTNLEKYGVENPFQSEEIKSKIVESNLTLFGCPYPMMSKDIVKKSHDTCMQKYGKTTYTQTEEYRKRVTETNLKKYGTPLAAQSPEVKEKSIKTCMQRYGVPYYCLTENYRNSTNVISKVNIGFLETLHLFGIQEDQLEFTIGRYSYDIKVGKYLIELNPSVTHNSTRSLFSNGKVKDKYYHQNKSKLAKENGYRCICVWDWMTEQDFLDIIYGIKRGIIPVDVRFCEPREFVYNIKKSQLWFDEPTKDCVVIYDDGVISTGV